MEVVTEKVEATVTAKVKKPKAEKIKVVKEKDKYGFTVGTMPSNALAILENGGTMADVKGKLGDTQYSAVAKVKRSGLFTVTVDDKKVYTITPVSSTEAA